MKMNFLFYMILVLKVKSLLSSPLNEQQELRLKNVAQIFDQSEESKNQETINGDMLDRIKIEAQKELTDFYKNQLNLMKILADDKDLLEKRQGQISEDLENKSFFRKPCPAHLKLCYFYG